MSKFSSLSFGGHGPTENAQLLQAMESTVGGATRFNRWLSQSINRGEDQDPWNDFTQHRASDTGEIKMAFDNDFHLTVIPNFLHDSDAYVANLENKLERLQQVMRNPSPKEMVAAIEQAKALRMKNAEMNPEMNAKSLDESVEDDDGGLLAVLPTLIFPISRRFFPRLALTREEAHNLLKYDQLQMHYQDEMNNAGPVEAEAYEIKADMASDTSWQQQERDSSIEQPLVVFESPEANELQIPKNWINENIHEEIHHSTIILPEDRTNARVTTNRSALSLSANTNAIQEASTITSFTPTRRSEDAFYHFAYIKTSMTSTQDSVKAETPSEHRACVGQAAYARSNSISKTMSCDQNPLTSTCSAELPYKRRFSFVPECDTLVESKVLSKSSANVSEVAARDQVVPTTKSSPSLKVPKNTEGNDLSTAAHEEQPEEIDENSSCRQSRDLGLQEAVSSVESKESSSERMACEDSPAGMNSAQNMILPEVTMASSSTKESDDQAQSVHEDDERVAVAMRCSGQGLQLTVPEGTVASSSTHDSLGTGIEGPWLFEKESDMSLGREDVLQHMSSLVRASIDEEDEPPRIDGNQASQLSAAVYTQLSSTCGCSDRTQTKASDGTSGNFTGNYSDPHSNLFDEESLIKREEVQAPIIRMYGAFPRDIHTSLQGNLLSWAHPRGAEPAHNPRETVSPKLVSLPAVNSDAVKRTGAVTHHDSLPLATKEDKRSVTAMSRHCATTVDHLYSDHSRAGFKVPLSKDMKCREVSSTKSQRSKQRSSASSLASAPSATGSRTQERPTRLSSSKLSTSSVFKNRQRSVHWFKTIEDVDSDTVVKDCDYMVPSQVKMKVPVENKEVTVAPKVKSKALDERSDSDRNDDSTVEECCTKFATHVLEEEVIVAGKVNSCLEFFETSCSKEGGSLLDQEDKMAAAKYEDNGVAYKSTASAESLKGHHEPARGLVIAEDSTAAGKDGGSTTVDTAELSEGVEVQIKMATALKALHDSMTAIEGEHKTAALNSDTELPEVLSMTASSLNDENNSVATVEGVGKNAEAPSVSELPKSLEVPPCQASFARSREQLEAIANLQRECATGKLPEFSGTAEGTRSKPNSCDKSTEVFESTGKQSMTALTSEQEPVATKSASHVVPTPRTFADALTQATLSHDQADQRDDDVQAENNTATGCDKCAPKPLPEQVTKGAEGVATQDDSGALLRDARESQLHNNNLDNKQPAASEKDKKKTVEGEDKENEDSPANRDTTILQCHELAGSSQFSTFSASNKGSPAVHRSLNMTRTLRITTTNQFKPLNLRRSITGILGSDSSLIGRPLSIQSREVVLPRAPQRPEKSKKPSVGLKGIDCAPSSLSGNSGSCKNVNSVNNTESSASELPARRSHSVAEGHTRANLGSSATRSKAPQTVGPHSGTAPRHTPDFIKSHADETPSESKESKGSAKTKHKAKDERRSQSQLPLKKRTCCRADQTAQIPKGQKIQNTDADDGSLPAEHKGEEKNAVAVKVSTNNADSEATKESAAACQDMPKAQATTKPGAVHESEDTDIGNLECLSENALEDRTISLVADSRYSTIYGAEINPVPLISAILGGDVNVESVKLCQSVASTCDCITAPTISKDNPPLNKNMTVSTTTPGETVSTTASEETVSVIQGHSPAATSKHRWKKGGERDVAAEVNSSGTSSTSVRAEVDTVEENTPSIRSHCDLNMNDGHADSCQSGGSYGL
ncbi:platelet binding protein GspB-like [Dermacentor albipictus]|uniref:platelet binding protein GspB-like n=1 Tax=Dermacentor albipictus TaxID=60249 RepID=UPI0038FD1272